MQRGDATTPFIMRPADATCGNLARRGIGDVTTLTVAEYWARSRWRRFTYRLYRHPLILFLVGPVYVLLVRYRLPSASQYRGRRGWLSILGTDVAAVTLGAGVALIVGPVAFVIGWGATLLLATTIGVWFFYVQHQFEDTYWRPAAEWDFHAAARGQFVLRPASVFALAHRIDRVPPHSSSR
jgi:omega-6 fatty acid desaturase (delta-12 desaturase)